MIKRAIPEFDFENDRVSGFKEKIVALKKFYDENQRLPIRYRYSEEETKLAQVLYAIKENINSFNKDKQYVIDRKGIINSVFPDLMSFMLSNR